jgi:GNAT superfamily N-acetyltransferase
MNPTDLDNLWATSEALFTAMSPLPGFVRDEHGGMLACWSPVVDPVANYVLRAAGAAQIDVVLDRAGGRGFVWKVAPHHAGATELARALAARGFRELPSSVAVLGTIPPDPGAFLPAGLRCVRVASPDTHRVWLRPFAAAFDVPQATCALLAAAGQALGYDTMEHLVLLAADTPVACGTLLLGDDALGAVFNLAVDPAARRQGHGTAMLAALAVRARELGATRLGQFSTPEGVPMYALHGTVHDQVVRQFVVPPRREVPCVARS